jgi:hypothetical protein
MDIKGFDRRGGLSSRIAGMFLNAAVVGAVLVLLAMWFEDGTLPEI